MIMPSAARGGKPKSGRQPHGPYQVFLAHAYSPSLLSRAAQTARDLASTVLTTQISLRERAV